MNILIKTAFICLISGAAYSQNGMTTAPNPDPEAPIVAQLLERLNADFPNQLTQQEAARLATLDNKKKVKLLTHLLVKLYAGPDKKAEEVTKLLDVILLKAPQLLPVKNLDAIVRSKNYDQTLKALRDLMAKENIVAK
jgi:hypothetical protein